MSDEELKRGKDLILDYSDNFSKSDTDVGYTNIVQHRIELLEDKTFKQRYRRIPPSMYDEVKVYLQQLLDMNINQAFTFAMGIKRGFSEEERQQSENVC